jgi:hypothetical protein
MSLETDLSKSPYFDTFNANGDHYQVLYRPSVAVQTRELNESQSIQQDQINKFGRQIFTEGSVVEGCQLSFDASVSYIKLGDTYANGTALTVSDLDGFYARSSSNVNAIIINVSQGSIARSPDLNTLYVKYTSSSDDGTQTVFFPEETISIYTSSNNLVGNVVVASNAVSGNTNPTGSGYIVHAQEGVIFQKGYFISTAAQSLILTKYNNRPNGLSVGYKTVETIETPESNTSLLDNAAGAPNFSAPGAHRLKLTPTLVSRGTLDTSNTESFFSIVDFAEGNPSIVRTDPNYSSLGKQLAQRTMDESGNYIIKPFNIRLGTKFDANNDIIADQLKLEIDPGLAYVNGYRVETIGKLVNTVRRGTDVKSLNQQVLTTTLGSYVFVKEYAGLFGTNGLQSVSLRSAAAVAVTSTVGIGTSVNGLSAAGSEIGTANIIAIQLDDGTPGSASSVYRFYLFNIKMNSGQNFSSVRSLYAIDGSSNKGFADLVLESGIAVLKEPNLQALTYPFNQKAVKTLYAFGANNQAEFDYRTSNTVVFASTGNAVITIPTRTGGTNQFPYGTGVLSNTNEENFIIVATTSSNTANISGSVSNASANALIGVSTNFTNDLAVGLSIRIANSIASEVKKISKINSATSLELATNLTNSWTGANVSWTIVPGDVINTSSLNGAYINIASSTSASIYLGKNFNTSFNAQVYYDIRRTTANPLRKTLYVDTKVKIDTANSGTTGPWCLGYPDVLRLKHVYVGATYSNSNPDLVNSFILDNGQKDAFYDLAHLRLKSGASLPSASKLLIELDTFQVDASQGIGYFSIDSYPVDDTGVTANTILTQNIPIYQSPSSGARDLRNSIDFRVYTTNTAVYTTSDASATINPSNTVVFDTLTTGFIPTPDSSFEADIQYYVGRFDKVGIDSRGNVKVLEGAPSESPTIPQDIPNMMSLAVLSVPPYPSLAPSEARSSGRYDVTTSLTYYKNRRYTMRDIGTLDRRITQLEYYTSLSTLELSTKSLLIPSSSGGNRFQHGILADAFIGHDIGNTLDPQYKIAIDSKETEARPFFQTTLTDSEYNSGLSTGTTMSPNGRLISLAYNQVEKYISQPFASKVRNCSQDINYVWNGTLKLNPEGDFSPDVTINPAVTVNLDLYSNWLNLSEAWGTQWGGWEEVSSSTNSSTQVDTTLSTVTGGGGASVTTSATSTTTTTTTTSAQTNAGTQLSVNNTQNVYEFGSYVTDLNIQPYLRPKLVKFTAFGLKPNTIFYAFFDDIPVSIYCLKTDNNFVPVASASTLQSSSDGTLFGVFAIPANTFFVGERNFKLVDVSNLTLFRENIQSFATSRYFGSNVSYAKNNITLNTTEAQVTVDNVTDNRTITTVDTDTNWEFNIVSIDGGDDDEPGPTNDNDPILQTFFVKEPNIIPGIHITSIDVFFNTKDPNLGVTLEIRNVINGFPGYNVIPFSVKHLTSSEINVSADGSARTRFTFDAPVFLENNNNYAFCIKPDGNNPNYAVWVSELGGIDIATKSPIFNNSSIGVMFTSSDNKTWTPYQKEDIKFSINRASFSPLSSTCVLNNDDSEYLTVDSILGSFSAEEKVYFSNNRITNTGIVSSTSTTVTNVSTAGFNANTIVYIQSNTGIISNVRRVITYANSGTTFVLNAAPSFTDTNAKVGVLSGNGGFTGTAKTINVSNGYMVVGNSTANSTSYLTSNTYVIAESSGASVRVVSVDNRHYSVVMPKFATSVPQGTSLGLAVRGISNTFVNDTSDTNLPFEQSTTFIDKERVVMSRTNEILNNSGNKSLKMSLSMVSTTEKNSPIIDTVKAAAEVIGNIINYNANTGALIVYNTANGVFNIGDVVRDLTTNANGTVIYAVNDGGANGRIIVDQGSAATANFGNNNTIKNISNTAANVVANAASVETSTAVLLSEKSPDGGVAFSRYISKNVILADGQDAEDLKVYVAAYKPASTNILVFAKFWNSTDSEIFEDKQWTQLYTENTLVSSKANAYDFIEYVYNVPNTAPIDKTAYLNTDNNNIIRYTNEAGQIFDTYKAFAIKIVLLSSDSSIVPRIQDYRAIAVSV